MKKKIISVVCILLAIILLIPMRWETDDGGTVIYDAILYEVWDVHRLNPDVNSEQKYLEGISIYFLGIEVFDNVR